MIKEIKKIVNTKDLVLLFLLIIFSLTFMCLTFKEDEEVTMAFISHSYSNIISIDTLDVHPPLYYLILKCFISMFTFWTKSLIVKTIVARLFSFFCFLLVFVFLKKIINLSNIRINYKYVFIFYCFMPAIMEVATHLRMYELATLFITIEYYMLIKFFGSSKKRNLFVAVLFSILASYTQYFIAIISVLFLFIFFIKDILLKKSRDFIQYVGAFILYLFLYLPIIPYVLRQFIMRNSFPSNDINIWDPTISSLVQLTASNNIIKECFDITLFISLTSITIIMVMEVNNRFLKSRLKEVSYCVLLSLAVEIIISVIYKPFFECRFIFPLIAIYFFLIVVIFLCYLNVRHLKICKFILFLLLISIILIFGSDVSKVKQNIYQYDYPSIQLVKNVDNWKHIANTRINISQVKFPTQFGGALYYTQNSDYLRSIGKQAIITYSKKDNIYMECNGNKKFVKKLFTNMHVK